MVADYKVVSQMILPVQVLFHLLLMVIWEGLCLYTSCLLALAIIYAASTREMRQARAAGKVTIDCFCAQRVSWQTMKTINVGLVIILVLKVLRISGNGNASIFVQQHFHRCHRFPESVL
jgi:hypothetical protein